MPTHDRHAAQAAHNDDLLGAFAASSMHTGFGDWYVTISFYSAVHHFEAMLDRLKPQVTAGGCSVRAEHSEDLCRIYCTSSPHRVRSQMIKENQMFDSFSFEFNMLYKNSRTARYECHAFGEHDWKSAARYLAAVRRGCL
jgi:hypothetical protein